MSKDKIHVAMLIGSLTKGGAERVLVNLTDAFIAKGWKVTMVTQYIRENEYPLNECADRVISEITEDEITGSRIVNFIKRFRKLRGIWKSEKPDVILAFIGKNNLMAILTSRFLGIPVAVSVRADPEEEYYSSVLKFAAKKLFALADLVILQTKDCFQFFPEKVRKRATILRNPIHPSFFREPYLGEREKTIVAVGRVDANKNHEMLIRAFAKIADEFPEYQLKIYGDGDLRESLIALTRELSLADRVELPGSITNVADHIIKSRIFVLPSNTEGSPNTLIEAMLMGLTVISTDCPCGGPADLIQNGKNGILTRVGDADELSKHLREVLSDPEYADRLGKSAAKVANLFDPEVVYTSWEESLAALTSK